MASCTTIWEDEDKNRFIELLVEYRFDGRSLEIETVTPFSVNFFDGNLDAPNRRILVWTDKARNFLRKQFDARVGIENLRKQLEEEKLGQQDPATAAA